LGEWTILVAVVTCASGALVFLRVVASALNATEASLRRLEKKEQRERKLRQATAAEQRSVEVSEEAA